VPNIFNVDVLDGLVNGARRTIQGFVKFDHSRVGMKAIAQGQYHSLYPEVVPIT